MGWLTYTPKPWISPDIDRYYVEIPGNGDNEEEVEEDHEDIENIQKVIKRVGEDEEIKEMEA